MILPVHLKRSLTLQCKKGTKISNWMAAICSGQIIKVIQNEVVFVFYKETLGVHMVKSLSFSECIICEVSIQNGKDYVDVVYRSPSKDLCIEYPPSYEGLVWDYNRANIEGIKEFIEPVNREVMFNKKSVHRQVSIFNETLMNIFSNFTPNNLVTFADRDPSILDE